ncbi:MAG: hypothetical protein ABI905_05550 [Betaproteobacteria bacterium]
MASLLDPRISDAITEVSIADLQLLQLRKNVNLGHALYSEAAFRAAIERCETALVAVRFALMSAQVR